jgi:hypothetical protein
MSNNTNGDIDYDGESMSSYGGSQSIDSVESIDQNSQDSERIRLIIKSFDEISQQINPKYRNCIDSVISDSYSPNTSVKYLDDSGYKIMFTVDDKCVLYGNGRLFEANKSDITIQTVYLDTEIISSIYTKVYKNIDKNIFDVIKFFVLFADIFNIDYKLLYDNIPYNHRTTIESLVRKKHHRLFSKSETALW